jgi:hypothetical protein
MTQTPVQTQTDRLDDLRLPPAFTRYPADVGDLLAQAVALAPDHGAGALLVQIRQDGQADVLSVAVVLEPEEPLAQGRLAFLMCMVALADAMAAHCPPERPVRLIWPDEIRFDKARIGGARLAVAPGTPEDSPADWMVFCADLLLDRPGLDDPGSHPDSTSLIEEAFDPAARMVETFASYLMLYADRWIHDGVDAVTNRYLMRIDPPLLKGVRRIEGDRLVEITPSGGRKYPALAQALGDSPWRGAGGPRL